MWRRLLSTNVKDPKETIRDLKRHVHRLYKHIHPDRLGRFPEHRAVNEASFQVLQDALDRHFDRVEARTRDIPPQPYQGPQQLIFYAHHSKEAPDSPQRKSLKKAEIPFHESSLGTALHKLFESLGLEPPPRDILPGGNRGSAGQEFSSLTELVKHARHVIMTNVKKQHAGASASVNPGLDDEMQVSRLAIQRSRGVNIVLGAGLPAKERLVLIFRRLVRTLAELRDVALDNLIVEVDGGFEVTLNTEGVYPWITVGACASQDTWVRGFSSEQLKMACEASKHRLENLRRREIEAAGALGVKLILHNIELLKAAMSDDGASGAADGDKLQTMLCGSKAVNEYEELLKSIIHEAMEDNITGIEIFDSLVLMFEEGNASGTDAEQGVIRVGLSNGVPGVVRSLQSHGARIDSAHKRLRAAKESESRRIEQVKRALGIGGLRRGEGVPEREWTEALGQLRADAGRLRGVLDGVAVVVGTRARILADSGEIEVPFDFHRSIRV